MYEQLSKSGNSNLNKRFFKILGYLPLASCSINQIFFGPVDKQPIPPPLRIKKGQMGEANEFTSAIFHREQKQKCRSEEIAKEYLLIV